jgi:CoA:oxalate CoA-transferase
MSAPLEGLRVVDFTRVLAGPYCTKALRDLGADVVKVEPPSGDLGRLGLPDVSGIGLYYVQQNAGKRNLSLDLNYAEAREIVAGLCRDADIIVENFRPGTLARFSLGYDDVRAYNPRIIYVSLSGYGQSTSWRNRPAFAPTVQAETGFTETVLEHVGEALSGPRGDACSHADIYTGLQGVVAVLAALQHRNRTGEGQHVDVSMAATMLSVNERAGAQLSGLDTDGEPVALSAAESHIFAMPDGTQLTIAGSPIYSPMFLRYCAVMRRTDLLQDPRYATAQLRRANLKPLLTEVRAWLGTFDNLEQLQAQISEAGLAVGQLRTTEQFSQSDWVKEWNAIVDVDDRAHGTVRMPGNPWIFSGSKLPEAGVPAYQGEHNDEILAERKVSQAQINDMKKRGVLLSRRTALGPFD